MHPVSRFRSFPFRAVMTAAALLVALAAPTVLARQAETAREEGRETEKNMTAKGFLEFVNTGTENNLRAHPGFNEQVVAKILAWRGDGKTFQDLSEFRRETAIRSVDFQAALRPFYERDQRTNALNASRKPIPEPAKSGDAEDPRAAKLRARETADAAPPKQISSAETEGPITDVRPGFFAELEGYESWEGIDPIVKKEFFETINREFCSCGCNKETLAFCYVNDPGCPVVRARVRKIYDDLVRRNREASAPSEAAPPN